jgi:DnaK suppressor protein
MALRKEKVEGFKEQLIHRRDAIAAELRSTTAQLINDETVYTDSVDQAAADTERNFALQLKNRERNVLVQINEALRRVENGTFGQCERCEEPISEGRIEAFPFTTLCIDCKGELESEEHRFPGRA